MHSIKIHLKRIQTLYEWNHLRLKSMPYEYWLRSCFSNLWSNKNPRAKPEYTTFFFYCAIAPHTPYREKFPIGIFSFCGKVPGYGQNPYRDFSFCGKVKSLQGILRIPIEIFSFCVKVSSIGMDPFELKPVIIEKLINVQNMTCVFRFLFPF